MKYLLTGMMLILSIMYSIGQQPVEKTNPIKLYMHYMPWFETPETIGGWGWHWTMNTMDPDVIVDGKRQIASHYYPMIGPYASRDKDVIEYHFLLMKLSGIDGILIDWYGSVGSNGDVKNLLKSSDSIVSYTDDFGLDFGVVLEDRFSRSRDDVKANLAYLRYNYFNREEYIRTGPESNPLLCIFGPITFETPADWTDILPSAGEDVNFVTLWYESGDAGSNASGEFSWVYQDELDHLGHLTNFYTNQTPEINFAIGSAYPGFNDFYEEGGAGSGYFSIPHYYGSTFSETLNRADQYKEQIDMLQLVTWNDFGEGTMIEPTEETGFDYLKRLQEFTGVAYGENELELVYKLFLHRKGYADNPFVQDSLDRASDFFNNLEIDSAATIVNSIEVIVWNELKQADKNLISIFPNPCDGSFLNITIPGYHHGKSHISIVSLDGITVYETWKNVTKNKIRIANTGLHAGLYILMVLSESGFYSTKFQVSPVLNN